MSHGSGRRYGDIISVKPKYSSDLFPKGNEAIFKDVLLAIELEHKIRNKDHEHNETRLTDMMSGGWSDGDASKATLWASKASMIFNEGIKRNIF